MSTLIDGLPKVEKEELTELTATMQTYRLQVYLHVVWHSLLWGLRCFLHAFLLLFGRSYDPGERDTMRARCAAQNSALLTLPPSKQQLRLREQVLELLSLVGEDALGPGDDELSAAVTRAAGRVFRSGASRGMSLPELCDYVYQQYPSRRKPVPLAQLRGWLLGFVLLPQFAFVGHALTFLPLPVWLAACVLAEVLWTLRARRQVALWLLARFLWLAASGTGETQAAKREDMPAVKLPQADQEKLAASLQKVRSLIAAIARTKQDCLAEKAALHRIEASMEQNRKRVEELSLRSASAEAHALAAAARSVSEKLRENRRLRQEYDRHEDLSRKKEAYLMRMQQTLDELQPYLERRLKAAWGEHFTRMTFDAQMLTQVVKGFDYEDVIRMEQRFSELQNSRSPFTLAEKVGQAYRVHFRTDQGEMGTLSFTRSKGGIMTFFHVERARPLPEPPANDPEFALMRRVGGGNVKALLEQLDREKVILEEQIDKLRQRAETYTTQTSEAYAQLLRRQKELNLLYMQFRSKQQEFDRQKRSLADVPRLKVGPRSLDQARLLEQDAQKELKRYRDRAAESAQAMSEVFQTLEKAEAERTLLLKALQGKTREVSDKSASVQRQIQDAIQDNLVKERDSREKFSKLEKQLPPLNQFVREAEKRSFDSMHQAAIDQLGQSVRELAQDIEALRKGAEDARQALVDLKARKELSEKLTKERSKQLEQLRGQLELCSCKVLRDKAAIDAFHDLLRGARRTLCVVAPAVGWSPIQTVTDILSEAVQKTPALKIELLHELRDRESDGKPRDPAQMQRALMDMERYEKRMGSALILRLTQTCTKLAICDENTFLLGNVNPLAFGAPAVEEEGELYHEVAVLCNDAATLSALSGMRYEL